MKIYDIIDSETTSYIGTLLYYEKSASFFIELQPDLDEWTAPLLFTHFVKEGVFTIPRYESFLWVCERIIPSGRQNIQSILDTHHMDRYDEMKFLEFSSGRCVQDSLYIKKTDCLPAYVSERQQHNLLDAVMLSDDRVLCFFADRKIKLLCMNDLKDTDNVTKILGNKSLFLSGKAGAGGYALTFNDSIDLPSRKLYEKGLELPLLPDDFLAFARQNVLTTSESCDLLECSRQNIAYLVKQEQFSSVKEDGKENLYIKGDLLRTQW